MAPDDVVIHRGALARHGLVAFSRRNIPAYLTVLGAVIATGLSAAVIGYASAAAEVRADALPSILLVGLVGAFGGMSVMFTASVLNLRTLRPGFERMARGEPPNIPTVWCPVLTSATAAAEDLASRLVARGQPAARDPA